MIRPDAIDTGPELEKYILDLADDHEWTVGVTLFDGDEVELTRLTTKTQRVIDGSVQYDATQGSDGVSRQLSVVIIDDKGQIQCDPDSPAHGALGPGQFIRVDREDWCRRLNRWVSIPVFHGPLTAYARTGPEVTLEAMGKELFMLPPFGTPQTFTFHKGHNVVDAIHDLAFGCGERKFDLPKGTTAKLHTNITIHKWEPIWPHIVKLAAQADLHVFYTGTGRLKVRRRGVHSHKFVFHGGDHGTVLADTLPSVQFDLVTTDFINTAIGIGNDPKGQKRAPAVITTLPAADPLSPASMKWNGEPLHAISQVTNTKWKTTSDIKAANERLLKQKGVIATNVAFESIPVPFLEELDLCALNATVEDVEYDCSFALKTWTLPLAPGSSMSVGQDRPHFRGQRRRTKHFKSHTFTPPKEKGSA